MAAFQGLVHEDRPRESALIDIRDCKALLRTSQYLKERLAGAKGLDVGLHRQEPRFIFSYSEFLYHLTHCLADYRYRLHPLKGKLKGYWSITAKANWRIVFRFRDGNALDVELIDYH